jgi:hypothetical protein
MKRNLTIRDILKEIEGRSPAEKSERLYDLIEQECQKPDGQIDMQLIEDCTRRIEAYSADDAQNLSDKEIACIYEQHKKQFEIKTVGKRNRTRISAHKRAMVAAAAAILLLGCAAFTSVAAMQGIIVGDQLSHMLQSAAPSDKPTFIERPIDDDPSQSQNFWEDLATEELYLTKSSAAKDTVIYTQDPEYDDYYRAVANTDGVEYVVSCSDYEQLVAYMNNLTQ